MRIFQNIAHASSRKKIKIWLHLSGRERDGEGGGLQIVFQEKPWALYSFSRVIKKCVGRDEWLWNTFRNFYTDQAGVQRTEGCSIRGLASILKPAERDEKYDTKVPTVAPPLCSKTPLSLSDCKMAAWHSNSVISLMSACYKRNILPGWKICHRHTHQFIADSCQIKPNLYYNK